MKNVLAVSALLCLVLASVSCSKNSPQPKPQLTCYVGGTMEPAVRELAALYTKQTGQGLNVDYSDSGECLIKVENAKSGDLVVTHDPFPAAFRKKGLAAGSFTVATLTPVIVVEKGNPKGIKSLKDLAQAGLKLGLTDETHSTLGYVAPKMFEKAKMRPDIEKNVIVRKRSGAGIANDVVLKALDAAIVWNAVADLRKDKLDIVPIEKDFLLVAGVDTVTSATYGPMDMGKIHVDAQTLACSKLPAEAKAFAEFLTSDQAAEVWAKYGFSPK